MKSILHTVDTWGPGGAESVCVELAAGLDQQQFHSIAAAIREGWVYDEMRARGLESTLVRTGRGSVDLAYLGRIVSTIRKYSVSLVQSHLTTANLYCGVAARLLRIPSVSTFHGMVDVPSGSGPARLKMRLIASNSDKVVCVSRALQHYLCNNFPIDVSRTVVIHNGVDSRKFAVCRNRALHARFGFPASDIVAVAVGNVRSAKGYTDLLEAAAVLRNRLPAIRFVVFGETTEPLYGQLLSERARLGLTDHVVFAGFSADVARDLNGADLYVNSSTSEGFSLTTIQAMSCGLPVVVTRSGGPEEIVTTEVDGLLVPIGDAAAFAAAVQRIVENPGLRTRLSAAARETVLARFSLATMVAAYERVYHALLSVRA